MGVQAGVIGLAVVVVAGAIVGIVVGTSGSGSTSSSASSASGLGTATKAVSVNDASTSTRGITADSINVVFPVPNLGALSSSYGFASDTEDYQQNNAINDFVNQINDSGGINGRRINAMIVPFDPTNEASMRALCKDWTEGNPPVFAVVDGLGAWTGDNELCVTQEGSTPMIAQWTTVTDWTVKGSPYLWWLGPDQAVILHTLVNWGQSAGLLGGDRRVGVIAGDRASDQLALNSYLLPDLKAIGVTPVVETLAAGTSETATTESEAPLVAERFKSAGVNSVIPLIPFNAFFPYLQAETQQQYFPRLLLSDYESSIEIALGLIPVPYEKALDGQEGISVETLGGTDAPIPESKGGYDPGVRSCWDTFKQHYVPPPGSVSPYIEEQGPIVSWCQGVRLFAEAAQKAGPNLNRRSFVQAMASIQNFQGTLSPTLSYGPNKFYGPVEYQVLRIHNNNPKHNECVLKYNGQPQGTCWQVVQSWRPLSTS